MQIRPRTLAIGVLPLAVAAFGFHYISQYGAPDAAPDDLQVASNSFVEAAGRLRMLATWVVMATLSVGATGYFLIELRKFDARSVRWLLGIYLAVVVALFLPVALSPAYGRAEHSIGEATLCTALGGEPVAIAPRADGRGDLLDTLRTWIGAPAGPSACSDSAKFRDLYYLNGVQRALLLLVIPAMILGAISALASGASPRQQAARLKTYLYMAAALFVCGLLYLSALLRWPGALLAGDNAAHYSAFVNAYLLAVGAIYSLVIISYYLPVASRLSATAGIAVAIGARKKKDGTATDGNDVLSPSDILKVLIALFAPVITALLDGVIKL